MDAIKGLFLLAAVGVVIWAAKAFFDAVGGWSGVIASVGGFVAIIFLGGWYFSRKAERAELEKIPGKVRALIEEAHSLFGESSNALDHAHVQLEERRGPVFWDKIYECNDAIMRCAEKLEDARVLIDDYNLRAPNHSLTDPEKIEPLAPAAYDDTMALLDKMLELRYRAMAVPEFGVIYEQRKQAQRVLDGQRALQSDLETWAAETRQTMNEAVNAANAAASSAEGARRASKRAAGDWF